MFFSRISIITVSVFMASCSIQSTSNKPSSVVDSSHPPCKTTDMYENSSEMVDAIYSNKGLPFNPNCISPLHRKDGKFLRELAYSHKFSNKQIFNIADKSLRKDRSFMTDVVIANDENYYALAYADKSLREDKTFMLKMLKVTSYSLEYASASLKKDKQFVWEAVKGNFGYSALRNADTSISKDKYFVLAAIGWTGGEALRYADDNLKKDKDVVLAAVKTYPEAIAWAHPLLRKDPDLIVAFKAAREAQRL